MVSIFNPYLALTVQLHKVVSNKLLQNTISTSAAFSGKHWNQKYRKLRAQKVIKVELPDFEDYNKTFDELSKEEIRSKMKEKGILPASPYIERPFYLSTSGDIFDPYVPPEGDGKVSFITKEGAKQKLEFVEKKGKSMLAMRKMKKLDDDFEVNEFLIQAQDIYLKAHEAMMRVREDKEELCLYVTERVYPEMLHNALDKTIHWKMIGLLDKPHLVQVRTVDVIHKENLFTQLTVRFHTQQVLAVYDRFGRLMYGSEILAKDVLEYIVFEKHISSKHGSWRIHAKIIPDWMPPKEAVPKTFRVIQDDPQDSPPESGKPQVLHSPPSADTPALATA